MDNFILSFAGFQDYLKTSSQRIKFISFFIVGSLPIILSCFLQYWFKIYGPFEFLKGLIIWYNKPLKVLQMVFQDYLAIKTIPGFGYLLFGHFVFILLGNINF